MRLVVHDYAGHPFQVQLSRALAGRGHEVLHLHFSQLQAPKGAVAPRETDPATFEIEGLALSRPYEKYSFVKRRFQDRSYGRMAAERIVRYRPDVVISGNTPIDAQRVLSEACREHDIPFVFWLQDIYGILIEKILSKKLPVIGFLIGKYYRYIERNLIRSSNAVVCISEDFSRIVGGSGVAPDRIHVVENWAPLDEIAPVDADNPWARRHSLVGKKVVMYSGSASRRHAGGRVQRVRRIQERAPTARDRTPCVADGPRPNARDAGAPRRVAPHPEANATRGTGSVATSW